MIAQTHYKLKEVKKENSVYAKISGGDKPMKSFEKTQLESFSVNEYLYMKQNEFLQVELQKYMYDLEH